MGLGWGKKRKIVAVYRHRVKLAGGDEQRERT